MIIETYFNIESNTVNVEVKCPFCNKLSTIFDVPKDAYDKFENGELVQRAFPNMSSTDREMLITGMCKECQENIFGKEE